ncbi:tumor necrosis factor receptor superfamily member 1A [Garra rufa]|uniref:tumor necrosis factor receptor superfamily member 1A n=1 Tax=Garra rufa TaxID=137080 RepID=UPI003CCE83D4
MWKCQLCACVLLILISQSYTISDFAVSGGETGKKRCRDNEYWNEKGFCCDKCHAGYKLKVKCSKENMRTECEKCEDGTYMDNPNYHENCFSCKKCTKPNSIEKSACTFKSNSVCGCKPGYYYKKLADLDWTCSPCKECGPGQWKTGECTGEQNTQCECKENHYKTGKTTCEPCVECRQGCQHLCTTSTPLNISKVFSPTPPPGTLPQILVPVCACITVLALGVFMVYEGIRLWKKKRRASSSQRSSSPSEDQTFIITVPPEAINESVTFTDQPCDSEQSIKLPDCVPREIKVHEFFYFVLDEVPIGRFKELVRRLGVSEQNIDRAEQDHRNCKDAHYQMLKVWSDSGSGVGSNVLPFHRIQMFVDTLKDMNLVSSADNIESRFLSQDTSAPH